MLALSALVPIGAELAAAAQVCDDIGVALLEPQPSHRPRISGQLRGLEAAIAVEQGRRGPVHRHVSRTDQEIGDPSPVARDGLELVDDMVGGIEPCGRRLDPLQRPARAVEIPERGGREIVGDAEQRLVAMVGRARQADRRVGRQSQLLSAPAAANIIERERPAADIVEHAEDELAPGGGDPAQRLPRARRPDQGRPGAKRVALPGGQIVGDERIRRETAPWAEIPRLVSADQKPPVDHPGDRGAARNRHGQRAARTEQDIFAVEEIDSAIGADAVHDALGVAKHEGGDAHVLRRAAINLLRLGQRLPPAQSLDHEGVAGRGHRPRPPFAGDEQRIAVLPGDDLLAFGQGESTLDEAAVAQIELADVMGVAAAVRKVEQAAPLLGAEAEHALIDPGFGFGPRQRVEIENGLPFGRIGAEAGEGGAPQQAADMIGILPEIVEPVRADGDSRDAVARLEDFERPIVVKLVARIALERAESPCVFAARPGKRALPLDFLEPGEGIVGGRRVLRDCGSGHRQQPCQEPCTNAHRLLPLTIFSRGSPADSRHRHGRRSV